VPPTDPPANDLERRVLVLAPLGRDSELTCIALREAELACTACASLDDLCRRMHEGCAAVILAEEAFSDSPMKQLEQVLACQPRWSDLPIILLTLGGGASSALESLITSQAMQTLGNVQLLERPTRVGTLLSVVRAALRARERQYQIRKHMEELEAAERSLARRTEELTRSNEELQNFAYIASHDLKEPLRGISNYANFLLEDEGGRLSESGRERIATMIRLTHRMYGLLDSLLEYSRVGRSQLALAPQDVGAIVGETIDTLRPWLDEHRAHVAVLHALPAAVCDRDRVGQVFANLIVNAVKYNDSPIPRVEIGATEIDGAVVFSIRDNGIGIPHRFQDTIFRMFRRLHPRDRYGGGTGAGLALVKRIVERHGGRVWLESAPGEGSTFYFTFAPSRPSKQPPPHMAPPPPPALLQGSGRADLSVVMNGDPE
jgi:signal transduction histidine kinase